MKLLFVSLGCDKNLVDSEVMLALLNGQGYSLTDNESEADVIIINTCCFINDAKEESVQAILEMAEYKKSGNCKALIVTGCLAQRYQKEIVDEIPEVDAVLGTSTYEEIVKAAADALEGKRFLEFHDINSTPDGKRKRLLTTGGHYAHLKIAEGCDKHCTYCIIPAVRGKYRSVPMEELVQEARDLAAQGVKELILVAQETTLYGVDIYGKKSLHKLLRELCSIQGIRWIRVLYCYPEEIYEELMQFVDEMEFERLGVFAYSPEEDTPAAQMEGQIPEEIKEERRDELMELQQEISFDKNEDMAGRTLLAMVEGKVADENAYIARTYMDAPGIDGYLFINTDETLVTGDFARVKVTGALEYDLIGEIAE